MSEKTKTARRKARGIYLLDTTGSKPTIRRLDDLTASEIAQLCVRLENQRVRLELKRDALGGTHAPRLHRNPGDGQ